MINMTTIFKQTSSFRYIKIIILVILFKCGKIKTETPDKSIDSNIEEGKIDYSTKKKKAATNIINEIRTIKQNLKTSLADAGENEISLIETKLNNISKELLQLTKDNNIDNIDNLKRDHIKLTKDLNYLKNRVSKFDKLSKIIDKKINLEDPNKLREIADKLKKILESKDSHNKDILDLKNQLSTLENKINEIKSDIKSIVNEIIDEKIKNISRRLNKLDPVSDIDDDPKLPIGVRIKRLNKRLETLNGYLENVNNRKSKLKEPKKLESDIDDKINKALEELKEIYNNLKYDFSYDSSLKAGSEEILKFDFEKVLNYDSSFGIFLKSWGVLITNLSNTLKQNNYSSLTGYMFELRQMLVDIKNKQERLEITYKLSEDTKKPKEKTKEEIKEEVQDINRIIKYEINKCKKQKNKLSTKEEIKDYKKTANDIRLKILESINTIKKINHIPETIEQIKSLKIPKLAKKTGGNIKGDIQSEFEEFTDNLKNQCNNMINKLIEPRIKEINETVKKAILAKNKIQPLNSAKAKYQDILKKIDENTNINTKLEEFMLELARDYVKVLSERDILTSGLNKNSEYFKVDKIPKLLVETLLEDLQNKCKTIVREFRYLDDKSKIKPFQDLQKDTKNYINKNKRDLNKIIEFANIYNKSLDNIKEIKEKPDKYKLNNLSEVEKLKETEETGASKKESTKEENITKEDFNNYTKDISVIYDKIIDLLSKSNITEDQLNKELEQKKKEYEETTKKKTIAREKEKKRLDFISEYLKLIDVILKYGRLATKKQTTEDAEIEYKLNLEKVEKEIKDLYEGIGEETKRCNQIGDFNSTTGRCNVKIKKE